MSGWSSASNLLTRTRAGSSAHLTSDILHVAQWKLTLVSLGEAGVSPTYHSAGHPRHSCWGPEIATQATQTPVSVRYRWFVEAHFETD